MKTKVTIIIIMLLALCSVGISAQEVAVSSVLSRAAKQKVELPIELNARDFLTKVYGLFPVEMSKSEIVAASEYAISMVPDEDETGLWLEGEDGYAVNYYGMTPEVTAHAAFDDGESVSDYGYFFMFPYTTGNRETANSSQASFSSTLLQEFFDLGVDMSVDTLSDALFEVVGDYDNDRVDVRLLEEHETDDNSGRFILILTVNPDYADHVTASLE